MYSPVYKVRKNARKSCIKLNISTSITVYLKSQGIYYCRLLIFGETVVKDDIESYKVVEGIVGQEKQIEERFGY